MTRSHTLAAATVAALLASTARAQVLGPTCRPAPGSAATGTQLLPLGDGPQFPLCTHVDQHALETSSLRSIFEAGSALFGTAFGALDGVGANLSNDDDRTIRFARSPRIDLPGWRSRRSGPEATSCAQCHSSGVIGGGGSGAADVVRDPTLAGVPSKWITRSTPHTLGLAGLQLVAAQLTAELQAQREAARRLAVSTRAPIEIDLVSQQISFGRLRALPDGRTIEYLGNALDRDLVVRPFQWKGDVAFLRDFVRDSSHHQLGMQASELVGEGIDGDGDGVADELTVGDLTTLTLFVAGQPPPQRHSALEQLSLVPARSDRVRRAVVAGEARFAAIGCTSCHVPALRLRDPIFREPAENEHFRDRAFPSGAAPVELGLDPATPIRVDLRSEVVPTWPVDPSTGEVLVRAYTDLRRHDLGPALAEPIDEIGSGASTFLTRSLWGVADTGPWLHDGRASTLGDAVLAHGGEAKSSRDRFASLTPDQRAEVIEFLRDLVVFKQQ